MLAPAAHECSVWIQPTVTERWFGEGGRSQRILWARPTASAFRAVEPAAALECHLRL